MKKEITFGAITGLLLGSTLLAPVAVYRTEASVPIKTKSAPPLVLPKLPAETSLTEYALIDERDLFRPAVSPELPRPTPVVKLPEFPGPPPWMPPTQGWVYAGYFTLDGVTQAVLQQEAGEAIFVKVGDNVLGGRVEEITQEKVRLSFGEGRESVLAKSDVFNAAPQLVSAIGGPRPGAPTGRTPSFRPGAPARLQPPASRNPLLPSANPAVGNNPSIQERAAQLRAQWEERRRAREEASRQPASSPAPVR